MTTRTAFLLALAVALLSLANHAPAQDDAQPLYVAVDCMKSRSADYVKIETDVWQPMHQALVDQGKRNSWALYWVMYGDRSECDYYTVTTYLGQDQLDANPDYAAVFEAVHGGEDLQAAMAKTRASREHVATNLWRLVDSTGFRPHRFAIVNMMRADDPVAYERMESRVFKAAHQQLMDDGHRAGWAVYELLSPTGSAVPYNYGTVDLVNNLAPVPMAQALIAANPERDLREMHDLLGLREQVRSETWALVATTTRPPAQ